MTPGGIRDKNSEIQIGIGFINQTKIYIYKQQLKFERKKNKQNPYMVVLQFLIMNGQPDQINYVIFLCNFLFCSCKINVSIPFWTDKWTDRSLQSSFAPQQIIKIYSSIFFSLMFIPNTINYPKISPWGTPKQTNIQLTVAVRCMDRLIVY